jgi:hypothetical protein
MRTFVARGDERREHGTGHGVRIALRFLHQVLQNLIDPEIKAISIALHSNACAVGAGEARRRPQKTLRTRRQGSDSEASGITEDGKQQQHLDFAAIGCLVQWRLPVLRTES